MVVGIETFRNYFSGYDQYYIVIGGTACDIIMEDTPIMPRATKDIEPFCVPATILKDINTFIRMNDNSFPEISVVNSLSMPTHTVGQLWKLFKSLFITN